MAGLLCADMCTAAGKVLMYVCMCVRMYMYVCVCISYVLCIIYIHINL